MDKISNREKMLTAIRAGLNVKGKKTYYRDLFIRPISGVSNRQLYKFAYGRYMGFR